MSVKKWRGELGIRLRAFVATFGLAAFCVGCSVEEAFEGNQSVALENIPAPAMEAAKKAMPGIIFNKAYKARIDGQDAFEIVGKTAHGKTKEVEVTATGKVLNIE